MPADYEASRQRDARFARRFTFTVATVWLTLHAVTAAAAVYGSTNNFAPLGMLFMLDIVAAVVGGAFWLSGKIFR